MAQQARVVIEVEESLDDDLDDETIAGMDYEEFEDRYEFVEFLWEKRFEEIEERLDVDGLSDRILGINAYTIDE